MWNSSPHFKIQIYVKVYLNKNLKFLMHQHLHVLSYNYTLCLQSQFDILTCVNFIREHADPVKSL